MPIQLIERSIVAVANQVNPSILGEHWLIAKGILQEDELDGVRICTPAFSHVQTKHVEVIGLPDRMQVTTRHEASPDQRMCEIISSLVKNLPETPYQAIGFNFSFRIVSDDGNTLNLSRRLFRTEGSAFSSSINDENVAFGTFFTRPWDGGLQRLNVRPHTSECNPVFEVDALIAEFNYQFSLAGEKLSELALSNLAKYDRAKADSEQIAQTLLG